MVRRVLLIALAVALCLTLSGCTLFASVSELLSPPYYSRESEALHQAFHAAFGKNTQFRSPISGDYLSAFVLEDLDADGEQEALVFYVQDSFNKTVRIGVLDQTNGQWERTADVEGNGSDVYSVQIEDLDADGKKEIVVCWTTPENTRVMSLYVCGGKPFGIRRIGDCTYTQMLLADLDEDSFIEILTLELISAAGAQTAQASVLRLTSNGLTILDKRYMDGKVSGYDSMILCPSEDGSTIFVDAFKGENSMITEVIVWNAQTQTISLPLLDAQTQTNELSWRSEQIRCRDLDADGVPEIPSQQDSLPGSEVWLNGVREDHDLYVTQWYSFREGKWQPVLRSLVHAESGYMFCIPKDWSDRFTVSMVRDSDKWNFYEIDRRTDKLGEYLCSVVFTTTDAWKDKENTIYSGYVPLCSEEGHLLIVYGINAESTLGISQERLQETFVYLSDRTEAHYEKDTDR